jgi:regulator of RNase E activity RraA
LELISLKEAPREFKVALLKGLGYGVDKEGFVVDSQAKRVIDQYSDKQVRVENMAIFPGSTIIMDDNLLSIASYIQEHEESA